MARLRRTIRIGVAIAVTAAFGGLQAPASAGTSHPAAEPAWPSGVHITRFLGEQRLPHLMKIDGTTVGGLSGIDRDPRTGTWYLISDDRHRYDDPRFYTGRLDFSPITGAFQGVRLTGATTLRRADGTPYPGFGKPDSADPEAIRFDPWTRGLLWGHEGDRTDAGSPGIPLVQPWVRRMDTGGRHLGELRLPANLRLTETKQGPRRNAGFEGLAVTEHTIAAMIEAPRYEDGELPTTAHGAPTRLTLWNRDGTVRAQYAYQLDPLPAAPVPATGAYDGGVSEILAVDDHRYLALERFWIEGVGYRVKLYEIDLRGATNVLSRNSLKRGGPYRPVTKRLVTDLNAIRPPVQNLESLAWGPHLISGECTLVIGSDDNFDKTEVTQFLAFGARGC
jgi:hypothetical protein